MENPHPLESIAGEVIATFDIHVPPVPIESMLQHPKPDMWQDLDPKQLSVGFLNIKRPYAPRMSLARYLARHIISSDWGQSRRLGNMTETEEDVHAFARMLIMPLSMVKALSPQARTPTTMSFHFEVPEDDAQHRLSDLTDYL